MVTKREKLLRRELLFNSGFWDGADATSPREGLLRSGAAVRNWGGNPDYEAGYDAGRQALSEGVSWEVLGSRCRVEWGWKLGGEQERRELRKVRPETFRKRF